MENILRPRYMNKIRPFIDKPVIKVLTGIRRAGKSTLLKLIIETELSHVDSSHIIFINFESAHAQDYRNDQNLMAHVQERTKNLKGKIYFFFDEIQQVTHWENAINAFRVDYDADIYITGSNSTLLSGKLATLLGGRYVQFEILPFTFSEFSLLFQEQNWGQSALFEAYIRLGGMPFIRYFNLEESPTYKYLEDVYHTVLIKDVLEYNNIRDVDAFQRIMLYIMENIAHPFSAFSISKYFKHEQRKISVDTILNYLTFATESYLIKKIPRYDALGKKILKVDEKYFLCDHGFRNAMGFSNQKDIERTLENIICNELLSRGYQLTIGRASNLEIDFIATKQKEKRYFQVCYLLSDESTRHREFSVFEKIKDQHPKYVLSMDTIDFSQNGILHRNIIDFLMTEAL